MNATRITRFVLLACLASSVIVPAARAQAPAGSIALPKPAASAALPNDVYSDSRSRLPLAKREEMDDYGRKVFDQLVDQSRGSQAAARGAALKIRLNSPKLALIMNEATEYLRRDTGFGDRLTEIAILTTAREVNDQFEWVTHEEAGLKAGVEPALIDVIKFKKPLTGLAEKEAVTIQFGRELFAQRKVSSETFAHALRLYGKRGLVDMVSLMCQYSASSALLAAFDMQLPEGQKPLLPMK